MISRRNIRVKVMQTLYSVDSMDGDMKPGETLSILTKKIAQSREIFTYLIYFITEVARYAETDARLKASKHLPTASDLNINTRISGNQLLWNITEDPEFKKAVEEFKLAHIIDTDLLKKIYIQLAESEDYKEYTALQARDKKSEKDIFEFILTGLMLPNEDLITHLEENFIHWDDDAEMMNLLVINFLHKPNYNSFGEIMSKEKWEFARTLLHTVLDKKEVCMELIKPKLKNWDADRIATLDLIILQMGVCEFLYFDTIPTKVTINEYIDLAKDYSTIQSGQFVNGLLDNIHKELTAQNKIEKKDFKSSDN